MKRAFVFPGQGTQFVGMGVDLAREYPEARELLELADDLLQIPLVRIMAEGPAERLMETEITQPAVLAVSLATLAVLKARGAEPQVTAGYSLGEYAALVAAGCLQPGDALLLVRDRARAMLAAHGAGDTRSMAIVLGPESAELEQVLRRCPQEELVTVAGYCVRNLHSLSGTPGGLDWLAAELERAELSAQLRPVPVNLPFHSELLAPAQETLRNRLAQVTFSAPCCPVIPNVTATPEQDPERLRELLVEQVVRPVRWVRTVQALRELAVDEVWELGPGRSLTTYLRKIDRKLCRVTVSDATACRAALERLPAVAPLAVATSRAADEPVAAAAPGGVSPAAAASNGAAVPRQVALPAGQPPPSASSEQP